MSQNQAPTSSKSAGEISCVFGEDVERGIVKPFRFQSLRAFAGWIKSLPAVTRKIESKYIVGALFRGNRRTLMDITGATILQLDFDKPLSPQHQGEVCSILELGGIAHVSFDTFSNGGRFVVLIPLARPATVGEHKATMEWVLGELGPYAAGLGQESFNPVLPRFISPNANNAERTITLCDGPLLEPRPSAEPDVLPDNVTPIGPAPIPTRPSQDRFALYTEQASPDEKALFLLALKNNLLPEPRLAEYPQWFPVIFAAFRAWAVNSTQLTESQQEMMETLEMWSKNHPKWQPDAITKKLKDWLRDRGTGTQTLHIQSLLTHEIGADAIRAAITKDESLDFDEQIEMTQIADRVLGAKVVEVIPDAALEEAATKRKMEEEARAKLRLRGLTILARAPVVNDRFAQFVDLVTAVTTQNKAEHWELSEDEWDFFLRPVPIIVGLCQMYAMGFAPHVMFRMSEVIQPKALNLYFLNIAPAGTGKSESINNIHNVLSKTVFKNLSPSYKLHSATGLWINAFERHGPLQLVTSDEAESLIGKQNQKDQHLLALQTAVKQLYDAGVPGRKFRPSAQVQRELQEITAPVMNLNLAATPVLLREDISGAMLNDGFVSRMIVSIDDRERSNHSEEELVEKKMGLINSKTNATLDSTIEAIVKFFNSSWRSPEAAHPAGREFFSIMGDEPADDLAGRISAHFERIDLPVRYITPPKDQEKLRKFSEIAVRSSTCWAIPPGLKGTDAEANIESLRVRAETKLCVMSAILTLVADPAAREINLEIMEWVSDILYTAQYPFYAHLLDKSNSTSLLVNSRINNDFIEKLRPAIMPGGPLHAGPATTRELRAFSYAWRKLIDGLKYPDGHERKRVASEALEILEVGYRKKTGVNNVKVTEFVMLKGLEVHE